MRKIILLMSFLGLTSSTCLSYNENSIASINQHKMVSQKRIPIWYHQQFVSFFPKVISFTDYPYKINYGKLGFKNSTDFLNSDKSFNLHIGFESSIGYAYKWKKYYMELNSSIKPSFLKQFMDKPMTVTNSTWKVPHLCSEAIITLQIKDVPKENKLKFKCVSTLSNANFTVNVFTEMFYA